MNIDADRTMTRLRAWYELAFGSSAEFDDPSRAWRRLFAEFLGTFLLVLVGAGGAVVDADSHGAISPARP